MEILFWSLLKYIWPFFTTGHWKAKRCSGNLSGTITWNQKHRASCFLWKSCSENFWELPPRKSFMIEHILKALNYAEYELCHWCFSRNFPEIFRTAILKENLLMDVPYFVNLWMSASDKARFKKMFGSKYSSELTLITKWYYSCGCCHDSLSCKQLKKCVTDKYLRKKVRHWTLFTFVTENLCYHYNTWVTGVYMMYMFDRNFGGKNLEMSDYLKQI